MKTNTKLITGLSLTVALSLSNVAHAEGFLSNLLGGSKSGSDFKTLLAHVPADTAYLMANKEPVPEKVMDYQIQRGKDILAMFGDSDMFDKAAKDSDGPGKFFVALAEEYIGLIKNDKFSETGLSLKQIVFYTAMK